MYILEKTLQHTPVQKKRSPLWLNIIRACAVFCALLLVAGLLLYKGSYKSDYSTVCFLDDTLHATANGSFERQRSIFRSYLEAAPDSLTVSLIGQSGRYEPWLSAKAALEVLEQWESGYRDENWRGVSLVLGRLFRQRPTSFIEVKSANPLRAVNGGLASAVISKRAGQVEWSTLENDHVKDERFEQFRLGLHMRGNSCRFSSPLLAKKEHGRAWDEQSSKGDESWRFVLKTNEGEHLITTSEQEEVVGDAAELWIYKGDQELSFLRHYLTHESAQGVSFHLMRHLRSQKRLHDPGYYLEQASRQVCENKGWEFNAVPSHRWASMEPKRGDVFLLHDPSYLSDADIVSLERAVKLGATLFFMPGPSSSLEMIDRLSFLPARALAPSGSAFGISWPDDFKVFFPHFSKKTYRGGILFQELERGTEVHATRDSGEPLWISRELGVAGGSVHMMGSLFHMNWSSAVLQSAFPGVLQWILSRNRVKMTPKFFAAGADIPSEVIAISSIRGDVQREGVGLVPGVQRWTYEDGREENVVINVDVDRLKQRHDLQMSKVWVGEKEPSHIAEGMRLDQWVVVIFGFCCLLELWWLYYRPRFD